MKKISNSIIEFDYETNPVVINRILFDINIQKKPFKLIYWQNNIWHTEEKELID